MIPLLLGLAAGAPVEDGTALDYRGFVDQARFFIKRGWYADAADQLVQATRHPDGKVDPEVWFLLAQVRYELADLPGARLAAEQALTWSRDEAQTRSTREWVAFLDQRFGFVDLVPPRPGLSSRVELELHGLILDPELKAWFERAKERLAEPVDLPVRLGLPAGYTYTLNGAEVPVVAGETAAVDIDVRGVVAQSVEVHLSPGVAGWLGADTAPLTPSPVLELGLVAPIGPLVFGARAGGTLVAWEDRLGDSQATAGWTAAGELGLDGLSGRAIGLRAGASLRFTRLDGLRVGCAAERGCPALGTAPGVWTAATWRNPQRSSGAGVGLRLVTERASGRIRDTVWHSWGMRGSLDVSWLL